MLDRKGFLGFIFFDGKKKCSEVNVDKIILWDYNVCEDVFYKVILSVFE